MKLIRREETRPEAGRTFTGPTTLTGMLHAQREGGVSLSVVRFEEGARTYWHTHPGEQVLYILEGQGRVGNEREEVEVGAGDVVHTPAGERHWHGAVPGRSMTHLSITTQGPPQWFGPPEE